MTRKTTTLLQSLIAVVVCALGISVAPAVTASIVDSDVEGQLELDYQRIPGGDHELTATVTATVDDGDQLPVQNLTVHFEAGDTVLGEDVTDEEGRVRVIGGDEQVQMDDDGVIDFGARLQHDQLGTLERRLDVQPGILNLSLNEDDRAVEAEFLRQTPDGAVPVGMAQVEFYILRSFGDIGFHGDFTLTDQDGTVAEAFPDRVPGDAEGNVEVEVRVDGHDDIGAVSEAVVIPWGEEVKVESAERALWAGRDAAPWWLLIVANTMLVGGWAVIFYVMWLVVGIRRQSER